jgi:hypothetical protein
VYLRVVFLDPLGEDEGHVIQTTRERLDVAAEGCPAQPLLRRMGTATFLNFLGCGDKTGRYGNPS